MPGYKQTALSHIQSYIRQRLRGGGGLQLLADEQPGRNAELSLLCRPGRRRKGGVLDIRGPCPI